MTRLVLLVLLLGLASFVMAQEAPDMLYTYDLTPTIELDRGNPEQLRRAWDEAHFVTTIQGIVNQEEPRLYLYFVGGETGEFDHYWLEQLQLPGEWLAETTLEALPDLSALIGQFRQYLRGLVVYDENVPATSNLASTIAGIEHLAAIRYDPGPGSLYWWLTQASDGPKFEPVIWLVNQDGTSLFTGKGRLPDSATPSSGSPKCDAYLWAKENYLDTGLANPRKFGYYLDAFWLKNPGGYLPNHTLTNQDYFIANKGFLFDLSPWDDEAATDEPTQPVGEDERTLKAILGAAHEQLRGREMIHVGGFVPWGFKYTNYGTIGGKHDGVPSEWRYAQLLSCFNAFMDADALGLSAMANASVYMHYPLEEVYPQKKPTLDDLKAKVYILPDGTVADKAFVTFYVGDYDAAAWLYWVGKQMWEDPARGTIPLGWAFNPNLADRAAPMMALLRKRATDQDFFWAGDSGAGYINPGLLEEPRDFSGLPDGVDVWAEHCQKYFQQWDLSAVGFIIDGYSRQMSERGLDAYATFAPDGLVGQNFPEVAMHGQMPTLRMISGGFDSPEQGAKWLLEQCGQAEQKPSFITCRTILWSPTAHKRLMELVAEGEGGKDFEFVDPYTLLLLAKQFKATGQQAVVKPKDLWDIWAGTEVTGTSARASAFDPRDMFGGRFTRLEHEFIFIFDDGHQAPYTHWIEWRTKTPVRLDRYELRARGDGNQIGREFAAFRLYTREAGQAEWRLLDEFAPTHPYTYLEQGSALLRLSLLQQPVIAQEFRAEFDQMSEHTMGPRIVELDGFGEALPE